MLPGVEHRLEVGRGYIKLLIQQTNSNPLAFSRFSEVLLHESGEHAFEVSSSVMPLCCQHGYNFIWMELKPC